MAPPRFRARCSTQLGQPMVPSHYPGNRLGTVSFLQLRWARYCLTRPLGRKEAWGTKLDGDRTPARLPGRGSPKSGCSPRYLRARNHWQKPIATTNDSNLTLKGQRRSLTGIQRKSRVETWRCPAPSKDKQPTSPITGRLWSRKCGCSLRSSGPSSTTGESPSWIAVATILCTDD